MQGSSAVEKVLERSRSASVRVFVAWEPILPTDWYSPSRKTLKRISDVRAVQFWDKGHLIATAVKQQLLQFHGSNPKCCEDNGHLWDMAAIYPPGVRWGDAAPIFDDGPVYKIPTVLEDKISSMRAQNEYESTK